MSITQYTNVLFFLADNNKMQGMDVNEIGKILGISPKAAKQRLRARGIRPIGYSGPTAIYPLDCVEKIKEVSKGGRPKKEK